MSRDLGRDVPDLEKLYARKLRADFSFSFPSSSKFGDQYDWTNGGMHDGNEWKQYRVVPHAHPSRPLVYACFKRFGSKGAFSRPGVTRDHFRCTVGPSPGHIRCRSSKSLHAQNFETT